ncbi:PAS fold-containing protein [Amycolatopsis xylanica]|uniref:PAS fold-containing protein n=1 Tax=Amycolatopsis xylanica TaxID=589385 RepID=A0A1H3JWS6_9PSEU|nr:PAS and ANTAR domain-containing protein [Amycolatopsis xylanica]SDY43955.1 PAS fold-containing protein [Amycolatopsis xylanica]
MSRQEMPVPASSMGNNADQVGIFHYDVLAEKWTWSPEIFEMHGRVPGEVEPTTELLRRHSHPGDTTHLADVITAAKAPFSSQHRIRAAGGRIVSIVVVGEPNRDVDREVRTVHGYFINLTSSKAAEAEQRNDLADEAAGMRFAMASRAPIEQAKGMIMLAYGCNAADAFQVLIDASQQSNTKLQTLATNLVAEMETGVAQPASARTHLEAALLRLGRRAG